MNEGYSVCVRCYRIEKQAGNDVADLVVPITYRVDSEGQHSRNLRIYKQTFGRVEGARKSLRALFQDFCLRHITCVKQEAGIDAFTHAAFVPSTRTPDREHPLQELLGPVVRRLDRIELNVNPEIPSGTREFVHDWFSVADGASPLEEKAVLLIDDTWVTGARAQSAAHALKRAGAGAVVTVVLARQLDSGFEPAAPIIDRISAADYDPGHCPVHR
ncbi:phosphoribosyltransferase [Nocardiopsis baichengensis]|uniref:phosphoribosyltransferase n=1 Tax=Nocardiopsis baichengensis TaxID=280240 RepID=UPI00037CB08A|nr:phosphoribosyltransferase [Nocardiopsis baichengensis]